MENKEIQIYFSLVKIITKEFAVIPDSQMGEQCHINFEVNFGFNIEAKQISVRFSSRFSNEENHPLIILVVECQYLIESESWAKIDNKQAIVLPKNAATHLAMITVGTCRGVLHAKLAETPFNQLLLPTIDVTELVPSDITFNY